MPEQPIIVSCYKNPDCDGYACVVAYCEFLNKKGISAKPYFTGNPQPEVRYLIDYLKYENPEQETPNEESKIILVDASTTYGIDQKVDPQNVVEIIDHRIVNDNQVFKNAKIQNELVGAAATLIFEKFQNEKIELSKESATFLFGGIISNTLNLQSGTTIDRDKFAAKFLKEKYELPNDFVHNMFAAKSDLSGNKLRENLYEVHANFEVAGKKIGIDQIEMIGSENLVKTREAEILEIMNEQKEEKNLDMICLTISDLEENCNIFVCDDNMFKSILEKILNIKFTGNITKRNGLIMRKQIMPLIKDYLEQSKD